MINEQIFNEITNKYMGDSSWSLDYDTYKLCITQTSQLMNHFKHDHISIVDRDMIEGYCCFYSSLAILYNTLMGKKHYKECYILSTLHTTITNSILAIISLLDKGLDYQINLLMQDLKRNCLFMLAISVDTHKLDKIYDMRKNNDYTDYNDYFSIDNLIDTVENYLTSQEISVSTHIQKDKLKDPFQFTSLSYTNTETNIDVKYLNLFGSYLSREEEYYQELLQLLYKMTEYYIVIAENSCITCIHQDTLDLWDIITNLGIMMNSYHDYQSQHPKPNINYS